MENEFEAKLSAAADKLGLAMKAAPEAEREILKSMYADYQRFVDENSDKQDVSALFAMGIISNNDIKTEDVIKAAVEYIDTDLEYCRWRQKSVCGMEAEFEAKLSAAADKLGLAMKAAPEAEREILRAMYADYQRFVEENNDNQDISALFAMGIISHNDIKTEAVIEAAVEYIDTDLEYCRWRQKSAQK